MTLSLLMMSAVQEAANQGDFFFPVQASTVAADHDWLFYFILTISGIAFLLINLATLYFVMKYRRSRCPEPQPSPTHNTTLEIVWSVIPTALLVMMFYWGMQAYVDQQIAPPDAMRVEVSGQKWSWSFKYPDGTETSELRCAVNQPMRLVMTSSDVIHSVWFPEFHIKRDVVPGRITEMWFEPIIEGEFNLLCAEYCGTEHSGMNTKVIVQSQAEFDKWMVEAGDLLAKMSPAEAGEKYFTLKGCNACHDVSAGITLVGPSLKDMFGTERPIEGGPAVVMDEEYIRESILEPQAKLVKGFGPTMPTYQGQLKDKEILAIAAYIQSLGGK